MVKTINLLKELYSQAEEIEYRNGKRDSVEKRAEMLFRKFFGDNTTYITDLKKIRYTPGIWTTGTPDSVFENSFNSGKNQLLNLLNVVIEDVQLDEQINKKTIDNKTIKINSNNIFIVHGHNEEMKQSVARLIDKLELNPIILHEQPNKGKTIIEKFTANSDVSFAVVLLSADDIAYSAKEGQEKAKFRARQNVIFELGYFIGKIGRERVVALYENTNDFEIPSDYNGVLFVPYDDSGKWQFELVKELKALNFNVDANKII